MRRQCIFKEATVTGLFRHRWVNVLLLVAFSTFATASYAEANLKRALKRTQYLLNATMPTDDQYSAWTSSSQSYNEAVRHFLDHPSFYETSMRYHERLFGTGLPADYLDELQNDNIDNKENKFARITCSRPTSRDRFRCFWSSRDDGAKVGSCPQSWEQAVSVFWYPGIVAWVCPTVVQACGSDLSRCFIEYDNQNEALNAELGTTYATRSVATSPIR